MAQCCEFKRKLIYYRINYARKVKDMKKCSFLLILLSAFILSGCSINPMETLQPEETLQPVVETLEDWSFQYNEGTDDYSVFFALLTKEGQYVSADANVDVRIVNDDGVEVYRRTHFVGEDDFDYYSNQVKGERYLADIRIPASHLTAGTNANGKVYLTVYNEDTLQFDEVNCIAFYCLPVMDIQLAANGLPAEIDVKGFSGEVEAKIKVEEVSYTYDNEYTSQLNISISGTKTYGGPSSLYDVIAYKLYDSEGYVIHAGSVFLKDLVEGDKFRDDSITIFDVIPGEMYTIEFSEYVW